MKGVVHRLGFFRIYQCASHQEDLSVLLVLVPLSRSPELLEDRRTKQLSIFQMSDLVDKKHPGGRVPASLWLGRERNLASSPKNRNTRV